MPSNTPDGAGRSEEFWREYLTHPDTFLRAGRMVMRILPSEPRCRLCTAPFRGVGGSVMRIIGKRQSLGNPNMCTTCENVLLRNHGGAEVDGTILFADIRGSTALAERMSPAEFHDLLDRFYSVASESVFAHDGIVDKFIGDELMALFFPNMAGDQHVARAVEAARALLLGTGHASAEGPWVPVGASVHTGTAWFGAVGEGSHVELTAVGDTVNVAARLASAAGTGEILVSAAAASAAGLGPELERRQLELKGKTLPTEAVVLHVARASR